MAYRLGRERAGSPARTLTEEEYVKRYGTGFGHAPTVEVNAELRRLVELEVEANGGRLTDKRTREIMRGNVNRISLVTADRLCTRYGVPLLLVYPELAA